MAVPYYSDDLVTLYHGDCREITEWLAADVLVTDPPYGIKWAQADYLTVGRTKGKRSKIYGGIAGDDDTAARDAILAIWGGKPAIVFGSIFASFPPGTRAVLAWKKPVDTGLFGAIGQWRRDWEPIFLAGPWGIPKASRSSVLVSGATSHNAYTRGHPHGKPLDLMESLIGACPSGVVADPFAGSGSTLVAAKLQQRRAIGVEIEEPYCEIAARRLAQDVLPFGEAS